LAFVPIRRDLASTAGREKGGSLRFVVGGTTLLNFASSSLRRFRIA